jgi:hypothetical protein
MYFLGAQRRAAKQLHRRAAYLFGVLALAIIAAITAGIFANRNSTLAMQNASIAQQNASITQTAQAVSTRAIADYTHAEALRLAGTRVQQMRL